MHLARDRSSRLFAAAFAAGAAMLATQAVMGSTPAMAAPKAVIELFTSQGCSSCPPADALLGEYAADPSVIALSLPVDYWDYLGWHDTLASPDHSERQRAYAASRGDRQVYTPQIVVNGRRHMVGSDRAAVAKAVAAETAAGGLPVAMSLTLTGDALTLKVSPAGDASPQRGSLWLVLYDAKRTVKIGKGENSGRTMVYHNVVRKIRRIAMWKGKEMSIDLSRAELAEERPSGCVVLLQTEGAHGQPGRMLGAATLVPDGGY